MLGRLSSQFNVQTDVSHIKPKSSQYQTKPCSFEPEGEVENHLVFWPHLENLLSRTHLGGEVAKLA
jgi:hypothetical protein